MFKTPPQSPKEPVCPPAPEKQSSHEKFTKMITELRQCKCCERHQTNRPTTFAPLEETQFKPPQSKMNECNCTCRHIIRMICRQHPDYWTPNTVIVTGNFLN
jgi:hypothetical protein